MDHTAELPESWRPQSETSVPEMIQLPEYDPTDPASLAAFFGAFGYGDHLRRIVLANCAEVIRARGAVDGKSLSEARIDQLSRVHPNYVEWIVKNLEGRRLYEADVLRRGLGG